MMAMSATVMVPTTTVAITTPTAGSMGAMESGAPAVARTSNQARR